MPNDMSTLRHTFSNGLNLVFEPMPWLSTVSLTFVVPLGAMTDPEGQEGSATVLVDWMHRGAGGRDSRAFSQALDHLGVRYSGGAGREYSTFSASLLTEMLPEALRLFADMLRVPELSSDEFESARALAQQERASLTDQPSQQLFEALSQRFFRSRHKRSAYGTDQGLSALTPESVREDYSRRFGPGGAILGVAGAVGWGALLEWVTELFSDWRGGIPARHEVELNAPHQKHIDTDAAQTQIGLAYPSPSALDSDWYAYYLAIQVLSGGAGSRLWNEVRERRGLVYSVMAVVRTLRGFGYTLGYAATTEERAEETLSVVLEEIYRLKSGLTEGELRRARTGLLSQLVMQGESSGARAAALAQDTFQMGRPRSLGEIKRAISDVSLSDINQFLEARQQVRPTVLTLGRRPLAGGGV
ncbi:MAG: insulinase family protein [Trueperaceae bacterium]|nr:MAG: insulinase family protein [Trueperaceae bacterium]